MEAAVGSTRVDRRSAHPQHQLDGERRRRCGDACDAARLRPWDGARVGLAGDPRRPRVLHRRPNDSTTASTAVPATAVTSGNASGRSTSERSRTTSRPSSRRSRQGDIVVVHDPQPAGLIAPLVARGAHVVWRCHVGYDGENEWTERAWAFLRPYVEAAKAHVFSRESFAPSWIDRARLRAIPPSIDPFTPKNRVLEAARGAGASRHRRAHHGRRSGIGHSRATPSGRRGRWAAARSSRSARRSSLPVGPDEGHARRARGLRSPRALGERAPRTRRACRAGSERRPRGRGCLGGDGSRLAIAVAIGSVACAPRLRPDGRSGRERAWSSTLSKRHAAVVVQKSLAEGFGLTVAEAMWKSRPVVASAVGGIVDQVIHERDRSPRRGPVRPRILRRGGRSAAPRSRGRGADWTERP